MTKKTCESQIAISVSNLKRDGMFRAERVCKVREWHSFMGVERVVVLADAENKAIVFTYRFIKAFNPEERFFFARFVTTSCHFGGIRYWYQCPLCRRRSGVLYIVAEHLACRVCHNLTYRSQNLPRRGFAGHFYRHAIKAPEIEKRIWGLRVKYWKGSPTKRYQSLLKALPDSHNQANTDRIFQEALLR